MSKKLGSSIADRVRIIRKLMEISQDKMARLLGVSTSFYAKLEQGYVNPGIKTLEKFHQIGVNINFLISGEPPVFLKDFEECIKECAEKKMYRKD